MFSVLIYETLGPVFSKIAIQKAGEIYGLDNFISEEDNSIYEDRHYQLSWIEVKLKIYKKT